MITSLFVGFTIYVLGLEGVIPSNASLIVGTGVATIFRFWSYRKWVFRSVQTINLPEQSPTQY
jgi:putative flippase GtrA